MITELKLTNWKSFEEATLYIDPLTVLIGSNAKGCGRSLRTIGICRRNPHRRSRSEGLRTSGAGCSAQTQAGTMMQRMLLDQFKPRLVRFFKGDRQEFERYIHQALHTVQETTASENEQPWTVE